MSRWTILLVNTILTGRSGTETALRDLALGLQAAGHRPMAYSPALGGIADELAAAGIPVVADLAELPAAPDIIHGNHHVETLQALFRFPHARALFVCHDRTYFKSAPPRLSRLRRYVAVDLNCLERLVDAYQIPRDLTRVIYNSVDLRRFPQRGPLPPRPRRAAVFSNLAGPGTHLDAIRVACAERRLPLDVIGENAGTSTAAPERVLGQYDLVFAKARCAMEAMAVGDAVVLCDVHGLGPMVTRAAIDELRPWNFGRRLLTRQPTPGAIIEHIDRYDAADARAVSDYIRAHAGLDAAVAEYQRVYAELMDEPPPAPSAAAEELDEYVRTSAEHVFALEQELVELRRPYRMEPLPESAVRQIHLVVRDAPSIVQAGTALDVSVEIQNGSDYALASYVPFPIRFACKWSAAGTDVPIDLDPARTPVRPALAAGARGTYPVYAVAPAEPGTYRVRATLVQEYIAWLDAAGVYADAVVTVR